MTEKAYLDLLQDIMDNGVDGGDRTGVGTRSVFGRMLRFDLRKGFPLLTTKKVSFHNIATELLWFIEGGGGYGLSVRLLQERGVKIWDPWANNLHAKKPYKWGEGDLGLLYGAQWRDDGMGGDPLADTVNQIKNDPFSRRHVLTSWRHEELDDMALAPCHGTAIQFYVRGGALSCAMYQRSCDTYLGLSYNIASYALLAHIVAHLTGYTMGDLVISLGDVHIYHNHFDQVALQLSRKPSFFPSLRFGEKAKEATSIDDFALGAMESSDFEIVGYTPQAAIKAPVAV